MAAEHAIWDHGAAMEERSTHEPVEPAHDVLAAEAFAVPAPDPVLHHGPVVLPEDPTGIEEPHDVLAAEEFAMPAPAPGGRLISLRKESHGPAFAIGAAAALLGLLLFRALRRG
jgi:hypothetical protein